jgi:drug/metabolite transporter (DMT)-like permease
MAVSATSSSIAATKMEFVVLLEVAALLLGELPNSCMLHGVSTFIVLGGAFKKRGKERK